jgi:hypothetical protein
MDVLQTSRGFLSCWIVLLLHPRTWMILVLILGPIVPKLFLISVQVLSNAIERLKGSPTSPDPKRVFRTVVSELARAYLVPASQLSHANRPERKITPGILAGLVQQVSTGGPNERVVQYHHARSNSVPKNSLQRRAIPQSLHQCGGDICAHPATCGCSIYTRGELRCVTIRFALWCRWVWLRLR